MSGTVFPCKNHERDIILKIRTFPLFWLDFRFSALGEGIGFWTLGEGHPPPVAYFLFFPQFPLPGPTAARFTRFEALTGYGVGPGLKYFGLE